MFTSSGVKIAPEQLQRVVEIEQNLKGIVESAQLKDADIIRLAALALAESERDLLTARSRADYLWRQLQRERRKSEKVTKA